MANQSNEKKEIKVEDPKQATHIMIVNQKSFVFKKGTDPEVIDKTVNEWIKNKVLTTKKQPVVGKCWSNGKTGETCLTYCYFERIEMPKEEVKATGPNVN
jgi:hypothetical protein